MSTLKRAIVFVLVRIPFSLAKRLAYIVQRLWRGFRSA